MNAFHLQIHNGVHAAAKKVLEAEATLFEKVRLADAHGTYKEAGYRTLWDYLTRDVKLTNEMASNCINVLNKAKEIPKLGELVASGELQISKARRVTSVLSPDNQSEWLQVAVKHSKHDLEKLVAEAKPETKVREVAKPVAQNTYQITICANEKQYKIFERLMSLASQKLRRKATQGEMLETFGEEVLRRFDPLEKAKRAEARAQKRAAAGKETAWPRTQTIKGNARPTAAPIDRAVSPPPGISAHTKHQVYLRDRGRCTHITHGKRCDADVFTEIHHVISKNQGGSDSADNLTTLCWAHHKMAHELLYQDQSYRKREIRPGPTIEESKTSLLVTGRIPTTARRPWPL